MTIDELIAELENAREDLGGEAEVRLTWQQNWPIRGTIAQVTVPPDQDDPYGEGEHASGQENDGRMLWIAAGEAPYSENPYGPRWAWGEGEAW